MKKKTLPGGHMRSTSFPLQWIGFSARLMLSAFVLTTVLPVSHITIANVSKIINATTDVSSSVLQEDTTLSMRLAFIFAFYSFAWCFLWGFFSSTFPGGSRLRRSAKTSHSPATVSSSFWGIPRNSHPICSNPSTGPTRGSLSNGTCLIISPVGQPWVYSKVSIPIGHVWKSPQCVLGLP